MTVMARLTACLLCESGASCSMQLMGSPITRVCMFACQVPLCRQLFAYKPQPLVGPCRNRCVLFLPMWWVTCPAFVDVTGEL